MFHVHAYKAFGLGGDNLHARVQIVQCRVQWPLHRDIVGVLNLEFWNHLHKTTSAGFELSTELTLRVFLFSILVAFMCWPNLYLTLYT